MATRLKILTCALLTALQFTLFFDRVAAAQIRKRPPVNETSKGLQLELSEGAPTESRTAPVPAAPAVRLSDSETQSVLKRLRPIKSEAGDQQDFALRDRSLPPPRTGKTITDSFPRSEKFKAPDVSAGPLEVLRYSPEGDVPLAPQLSVTFSQPMVTVTSHADTIATPVPVKLTPQPRGHWRWVGAKTLLFEPEGRFPMATEYTAEVPAGTKSATGATLAAAKIWKFTTPPPQVKSSYPNDGPTVRDPLMFVEFDQRINPTAVVDRISVRSRNREWKARLASADEIEANETITQLTARAGKDRWLAFRVAGSGPLPADSPVTVTIPAGTPSAEGPRATTASQRFSFRTYGGLRVIKHECGWREGCSPFDDWSIDFTNPLDEEKFQQSQVRVEEVLPSGKRGQSLSLKSSIAGSTLEISGVKRGRRSYRVTLDPSIRDEFGQELGVRVPIIFNVGPATPIIAGPDKLFVVLDPAAPPQLAVYSVNHSSLRVRLYSVAPEHWKQFLAYTRDTDGSAQRTPPGKLALSKTVTVESRPDELTETRIDLAPALDGGVGQVVVIVEPAIATGKRDRDSVIAWAQVTQIGLDAFVDNTELIGWATSLRDGKPIDGAKLSIEVAQAGSLRSEASAITHSDGIARVTLNTASAGPRLLVARKGRDVAILPETTESWRDTSYWTKSQPGYSVRWFVFDDRKMYRPGEEVHVKGWIRRIGDGRDGDVGPLPAEPHEVDYVVKDSRGQ